MSTTGWKATDSNNLVLDYKDFYISYNPNTYEASAMAMEKNVLSFDIEKLGNVLGHKSNGEETALCCYTSGSFLILNGDFRKEYEEIGDNLEKAISFFRSKEAEFNSDWTVDRIK